MSNNTDTTTTFTATTDSDLCGTCQVTEWVEEHGWDGVSERDKRAWAMWGCVCTPESMDEALTYMNLVTR